MKNDLCLARFYVGSNSLLGRGLAIVGATDHRRVGGRASSKLRHWPNRSGNRTGPKSRYSPHMSSDRRTYYVWTNMTEMVVVHTTSAGRLDHVLSWSGTLCEVKKLPLRHAVGASGLVKRLAFLQSTGRTVIARLLSQVDCAAI